LPPGEGKLLLDVGSSWGRWSVAAARLGYKPVLIDPSVAAVMAARRVFHQLGLQGNFVVGDARQLPFASATFDAVYSYSVIQHFSRTDAAAAFTAMGRVLKPGGTSLVQMPTILGIRCLYHQLRRRFREPTGFDVRYYSVPALHRLFNKTIGPTKSSVDCFFGIGLQASDLRFMTGKMKFVVRFSELLRKISGAFPPLKYLADSVFLKSQKAS
jgi:SAM-dependent methyltransferase